MSSEVWNPGDWVAAGAGDKWTPAEWKALLDAIAVHGNNTPWSVIASRLNGRTPQACRMRWLNYNEDCTKKGNWIPWEEFIVTALHCELGSQWCRITPHLIARTQNACKNHWNATWRSKMPNKAHSLVWLYVQELKRQASTEEAFRNALVNWERHMTPQHIQNTVGLLPTQALAEGQSIDQMVDTVYAKALEAFGPAETSTPLLDYQHLMATPEPVRASGWTAPPTLPSAAHSTQRGDVNGPKRGPIGSVGATHAARAPASGGGQGGAFKALPRPVLAVPPPTCVIDFPPLLGPDARLQQRVSADSSQTGNSERAHSMPQRRAADMGLELNPPTKRVRTSLTTMPNFAPLPLPTQPPLGLPGLPLGMQAPVAWGYADGEDVSPLTPQQPPAASAPQLMFDPATGAAAALLELGQSRPNVVSHVEGPAYPCNSCAGPSTELHGYADPMLTRATAPSPRPVLLTQLAHMKTEAVAPHKGPRVKGAGVSTPTSGQFALKPTPAPAPVWQQQQQPAPVAPPVRLMASNAQPMPYEVMGGPVASRASPSGGTWVTYPAPVAAAGPCEAQGPYGYYWQQPAPQSAPAPVRAYAPVARASMTGAEAAPQHSLLQMLAMPPTSSAVTADTMSAPTVTLEATSAGRMDVQSMVGGGMQWQGARGVVGQAEAPAPPVAVRGADGAVTFTLSVSQQQELLKALLAQHGVRAISG